MWLSWPREVTPRGDSDDGKDDDSKTTRTKTKIPSSTPIIIASSTSNTKSTATSTAFVTTTTIVSLIAIPSTEQTSSKQILYALSTPPASTATWTKTVAIKPTAERVAESVGTSSPPPDSHPSYHHEVSKPLIAFGVIGIVAIIVLLITIIFLLRKRNKKILQANNNSSNDDQPKNPFTPNQLQQASMPSISSRAASKPMSFYSQMSSLSATMATPIPQQYQQYAPAPLNINREGSLYREEDKHASLNPTNPFMDPVPNNPRDTTHSYNTNNNEGPFTDPTPIPTTLHHLTQEPTEAHRQPPLSMQSVQSSNTNSNSNSNSTSSKFSNFASLLHPRSTVSSLLPASPTRSSKFSNFRSLLGGRSAEEEEKRRLEDQKRTLARLAGEHRVTLAASEREEKVKTGYF